MLDNIIKIIQTVGFPIFVATYLILRIEKTLRDVNTTLHELITLIKIQEQNRSNK